MGSWFMVLMGRQWGQEAKNRGMLSSLVRFYGGPLAQGWSESPPTQVLLTLLTQSVLSL